MQLTICSWTISWNIEVFWFRLILTHTLFVASLFAAAGCQYVLSIWRVGLTTSKKENTTSFCLSVDYDLSSLDFVLFFSPIFTWFLHTDTCILKFKLEIYIQPIIHNLAENIPIFSQEFCIKVPTILLLRGRGVDIFIFAD